MINYIKNEANKTFTENGAVTNLSTYSDCLDFFACAGAIRGRSNEDIIACFAKAFYENADLAMKLLFYSRDIRGGLGERRVFRVILEWLAQNAPASVRKNLEYVAEFGRFDDLLAVVGTACENDALTVIKNQLNADIAAMENGGELSLLAKWLPSVNASSAETVRLARKVARFLGMSDAQYRKTLVKLRAQIKIIENNLRERDYSFDYSKQPSKAMFKYRAAFARNDGVRYSEFLNKVRSGEATLHTGTLMPYDIVSPLMYGNVSGADAASADVTWNSLEDFGSDENALAVIDGSGSMYSQYGKAVIPASVALSLGIYFAEHNNGAFANHFITFSTNPRLVSIKGSDILSKVRYCESFNECSDTNIQKVFELILSAALENNVPAEQMPSKLYIISDMEFNYCTRDSSISNFMYAKRLFEAHGYKLPQIIFWNVSCRNGQYPVTMNEQGVALVSGCTPRMFSMVTSGNLTPYAYMMDVINSGRYDMIAA